MHRQRAAHTHTHTHIYTVQLEPFGDVNDDYSKINMEIKMESKKRDT